MVHRSVGEEYVGKLAYYVGVSQIFTRVVYAAKPQLIFTQVANGEIGIIVDIFYENDESESVSSTLYVEMLFDDKRKVKIPFDLVRVKK